LGEAGLAYIFTFGENYRVAAVETGGKQMSTGHLHLDGFKSLIYQAKNKGHPKGCPLFLVGEAGLEPARPQ